MISSLQQLRIARPTNNIEKIKEFYCGCIGLKELGSFNNHDGYDGIMIGLTDESWHLEFTNNLAQKKCDPPTKDNLLVFYFKSGEIINTISARLESHGYPEKAPENPYWNSKGKTYEDPDGWRIVLCLNNPTEN